MQLDLANEEEAQAKKDLGKKGIKPTISATSLIAEALDLEDVMYVFCRSFLSFSLLILLCSRRYKYHSEHQSLHPTDLQKAQLADRGFSILRRMEAFFEAQGQHLPSAKDL